MKKIMKLALLILLTIASFDDALAAPTESLNNVDDPGEYYRQGTNLLITSCWTQSEVIGILGLALCQGNYFQLSLG